MIASVIIPFYNSHQTIEKVLDNIQVALNNNFKTSDDFEIIIIDDYSEDNFKIGKKKRLNISVIRNSKNEGPSFSRNRGADIAKGEFLFFIDSDVLIPSSIIINTIKAFKDDNSLCAQTAKYSCETPQEGFFSYYKNIYMNFTFSQFNRNISFLLGAFIAIRKEKFQPFNEKISKGEDSELASRILLKKKKINLIEKDEVIHLKNYTLISFIKNNFIIPFYFSQTFIKRKTWKNISKKNFSHISTRQILIITSSGFFLLGLFFSNQLTFFSFFIFIYLNKNFYNHILKNQKKLFLLKSIPISLMDSIIMGLGIFFGLIYFSLKKQSLD